jgi:PAS domain S-box-containing protein
MLGTATDITERKRAHCQLEQLAEQRRQAEEEIRQREQRYRGLVENIDLGVLQVDAQYQIITANSGLARMTRQTELLGRHCFSVLHRQDQVCPDCLGTKALATGRSAEIERLQFRADGTSWMARILAFPLLDAGGQPTGFIEVVEDVTERRRREAELHAAQREKAAILDGLMSIGIEYLGTDMKLVWANDAMLENLAIRREQIDGRRCFEIVRGRKEPCEGCIAVRALATGQPQEGEKVTPGGRILTVRTNPVTDAEGRVIGAVHAAMDITEQKRLEQQLLQAQKMEAIGQLAGGIAHDFRNQLTVIKGYGEMLRRDQTLGPEARTMLEEILQAAARAARSTGQLLAFSRRDILHPQPADLSQLIGDVAGALERVIGEDVELSIAAAAQPCIATVDAGQFQQALMNLVTNARDAMPRGGKLIIRTYCLEADTGRAARQDMAPGPCAVVSVSDTGCGMDDQVRARIFEPFFTTKEVGKGTGLGLAMVYGFVRQSGGAVEVESVVAKGTEFRLYFPLSEAPAAGAPAVVADDEAPRGSESILLVEDEPAVRGLVAASLLEAGYRVLQAADGAEALRLFNEHAASIDALVTDVVMPGSSGADLAAKIRALRPQIAVLYVSGYADRTLAHRGIDSQAELLFKPFSNNQLLRTVRQLLDRAGSEKSCLAGPAAAAQATVTRSPHGMD